MPNAFDPNYVLGERLSLLSRKKLCELASELCTQIMETVGNDSYRGGIYPENISVDDEGNVAIGEAKEENWSVSELRYLAPEVYWDGEGNTASDVYSIGLLLYSAFTDGKLPFEEEDQKSAIRRRMDGESFEAPKGAARRLGEIITRATAFKSAERYRSVYALKAVLDSYTGDMYALDEKKAGNIFQKDEGQLSDIERMMLSIAAKEKAENELEPVKSVESEELQESEDAPVNAEENAEETAAEPVEEAPEAIEAEETPAADTEAEDNAPQDDAEPEEDNDIDSDVKIVPETVAEEKPQEERQPIPILTVEENPELEPVSVQTPITPKPQYKRSGEREKRIREEARKRRRRSRLAVVFICALLILAALLLKMCTDQGSLNMGRADSSPTPELTKPTPDLSVIPTVEPAPTQVIEPTPTPEPTYEIIRADVSWEEAQRACTERGGHLAVIHNAEELNKITALAAQQDIYMLWIGCHRENGELVWENGEEVETYFWAAGEPSGYDSYDDVAEDYVMLWDIGQGWMYNDSRNDPIASYPGAYSGNVGYVCEYN